MPTGERRFVGVLTAIALSLAAPAARAQDEVDASTRRAEALAEDAFAKQARGEHADAVTLYLEAYKESPASIFLYDAAYLYDRMLGARGLALEYYRRAIAAGDLESDLVARARARIAEL